MANGKNPLGIIVEKNVPVPMRDGATLRANVFRPNTPGKFPGILMRTPYGKAEGGFERFVRSGYVFVTQDTRGRYASDGEYINGVWTPNRSAQLAAALLAVADQVVPAEEAMPLNLAHRVRWDALQSVRYQLLAIAAELKAQ